MNTEETLKILLKLVNGDKEQCYQQIETIRKTYPGKSMQWCIEKAIYDIRFGKKTIKPNATLSRWTESNPPSTKKQTPPPPPNPTLNKAQPKEELRVSASDLAALAQAKRKSPPQPASASTKSRLDSLTKDRRVSDRLVQRIQLNNPDRSEQWAYEKAIADLERDRL